MSRVDKIMGAFTKTVLQLEKESAVQDKVADTCRIGIRNLQREEILAIDESKRARNIATKLQELIN